jgi:hypothetical protein
MARKVLGFKCISVTPLTFMRTNLDCTFGEFCLPYFQFLFSILFVFIFLPFIFFFSMLFVMWLNFVWNFVYAWSKILEFRIVTLRSRSR